MHPVHFAVPEGHRIIELGCGENPHPGCHVRTDVRKLDHVDFTADLNEPLPIKDEDFEGVYSAYTIEHLSWRKVRDFIKEVYRILKNKSKAVFVTANTVAQIQWLNNNPQGWDNKPFFESASCVLFGDQDYPENTHKNFMSPLVAETIFKEAGFFHVEVKPCGDRQTDMIILASKDTDQLSLVKMDETIAANAISRNETRRIMAVGNEVTKEEVQKMVNITKEIPKPNIDFTKPEKLYDKDYFNGGGKVGGYAREGYRDFPIHEVTARHLLARKPESVLELGAARGYILKRLEDAGVKCTGIEVSKHCYMTRASNAVKLGSLLDFNWDGIYADLCYSVATLEHIPEQYLPDLIRKMSIHCKRGLHGIDFGEKDDGFDKTHCSLFSKAKWLELFAQHAPGWPCEVVDKEELERGSIPQDVLQGDGKTKINLGSYTVMHHYGWINVDIHDLGHFAQSQGYKFHRHDLKNGLPFGTGAVDLFSMSHTLEHFSYDDGLKLLKEVRRCLKPGGVIRIAVPDAELLIDKFKLNELSEFGEINDVCASNAPTIKKFHSLLYDNHLAIYDGSTLHEQIKSAGLTPQLRAFREGNPQILKETLDMFPCLSLYMEGTLNV